MKYLSPIVFIKRLISLVKEIINFIRYIKITKSLEESGELAKIGLRRNSLGRLYYVKNLQPEILLNAESIQEFEIMQVKESLAAYNEPIMKLGILDFVKTGFRRIKNEDYYAYLIWMEFDQKSINTKKILYVFFYGLTLTLLLWKIIIPFLIKLNYSQIFHTLNH